MSRMTDEQEAHLQRIKDDFLRDVDAKYRKGQAEHGGDLWKKPGVLEMAMDECVDHYVYCHVLKEQRDNPELVDPTLHDDDLTVSRVPVGKMTCPKCGRHDFKAQWGEFVSCYHCLCWLTYAECLAATSA